MKINDEKTFGARIDSVMPRSFRADTFPSPSRWRGGVHQDGEGVSIGMERGSPSRFDIGGSQLQETTWICLFSLNYRLSCVRYTFGTHSADIRQAFAKNHHCPNVYRTTTERLHNGTLVVKW